MNDPLLELVPWEQHEFGLPLFTLLRAPTSLDAFDWQTYRSVIIRCENHTLIFICEKGFLHLNTPNVFFTIDVNNKYKLEGAIYGATDAVIVETATFFWSLKHPEGIAGALLIGAHNGFRVDAFTPEQLVRIMDANPTRQLALSTGVWTAQQSVILATRPYRLDLVFCQPPSASASARFEFEDGGTAFVNALEERRSCFGSLCIAIYYAELHMPFSQANLERLFKLEEIFNEFGIRCMYEEGALLPFSAKTQVLDYAICATYIQPQDFDTIHVAAKRLKFALNYLNGDVDNWDVMLISFLNRVAQLGHFESLCFSVRYFDEENIERYAFERVARVAEALICAINANPNLRHLDLSKTHHFLNWGPHLQNLFKAMEERKGPLAIILSAYPLEDPGYSWLKQLLSRNRNIAVYDRSCNRITDGSTIDKLYALNRLYRASAWLVKESPLVRPWLVGTALVEKGSKNFQRTALLLSDHEDVLCDFIAHHTNMEECVASQSTLEEA